MVFFLITVEALQVKNGAVFLDSGFLAMPCACIPMGKGTMSSRLARAARWPKG